LFKNIYLQVYYGVYAALIASVAQAQSNEPPYPLKPVRFVVGQAPRGATDLVARTLTARLGEAVGQSMIVDNRTGAAGAIGAGFVAKSAPDGYTLLGTHAGVIQRMNSELAKVIALPDTRQKLASDGAEAAGGSPEHFQKHLAAEIAKWSRVVKAAGIRVA
jgi:tripartite-type tricarboxylate transporter receptor subunit TctC